MGEHRIPGELDGGTRVIWSRGVWNFRRKLEIHT
jgi:hypothetical protein